MDLKLLFIKKENALIYEEQISRALTEQSRLAVVGHGVKENKGGIASNQISRKSSRASRSESVGSLAMSSYAAYDTSVLPFELRNQNLYIQSLQHREPQVYKDDFLIANLTYIYSKDPPVPPLHDDYALRGKQRHVGGGGMLGKKKAHLVAYPPILSLPPQQQLFPPQVSTCKVQD